MTTTSLPARRWLPLFLAAFFVLCVQPGLRAQADSEPVTIATPLTLAVQPMPGETFDIVKYAPEATSGSYQQTILFKSAKIGKTKNASLELALDGARIVSSTLYVKGPKAAKSLRKQLIKQYGNPTQLTIQKGKETMSWSKTLKGDIQLSSSSDTEDSYCTARFGSR